MLEIRKNRFAKPYENEFFRVLAEKLSVIFNELKLNGVLIGSPVCTKANDLQIDVLLIAESAILIIDLKNYKGNLFLPRVNEFETGDWILKPNINQNRTVVVKGGSNKKNPFKQINLQRGKLNTLFVDYIIPYLNECENIDILQTCTSICFQQPVKVSGVIPDWLKHAFYIADPRTIVNRIRDIFDVTHNEWDGVITGNKLTQNAFNLIKKIFLADSFDPFRDNNMFVDFEQIEYPENEIRNKSEIVDTEFEKNKEIFIQFINSEIPVLIINGDVTAYKIELIEKITSFYLKTKVSEIEEEETPETKVCYLAPTNRNVSDLIRIGAPINTHSLYGVLYDYEHSTIELLSNSLNEKEVFPLLESKEVCGMLYVIFNSHLVYNFASAEDEMIKFGTGSLCNDTLTYLDLNVRKNKVIFVNDPYFYGFRAETIVNDNMLNSKSLEYLKIDIASNPIESNQKNITDLVENLKRKNYSNFSFNGNENISYLFGDTFRTKLAESVKNNSINGITIFTHEKGENPAINNWIRKNKGISENEIQVGDLIYIKNKSIVPEEIDPFSIPKYVLSGDIGELLNIYDRYSFGSEKYPMNKIDITKCKVQLRDYDVARILYVSNKSIHDIKGLKELKQHIQIRSRELVENYLQHNNIQIKDILQPFEFEQYNKEKKELIPVNDILFDLDQISNNFEISHKETKKLDAKWKINKRKEKYVKQELLKDFDSEFFKITQMIYFDFAWALCLKSCYGYKMKNSFLIEYSSPLKNIIRFHQYIYSALGCSDHLTVHNFSNFSPWFGLDTDLHKEDIPENLKKKEVLIRLEEMLIDEKDRFLIEKYKLAEFDPHLSILCRWVNEKLKNYPDIELQQINHFNYQEKYIFKNSKLSSTIIFYYNGKWEVKYPQKVEENELSQLLIDVMSITDKDPYIFLLKDNWKAIELDKLQSILISKGASISEIISYEWVEELSIVSNSGSCQVSLHNDKSGFFSNLSFRSKTNDETCDILLEAINEIKNNG